LIDVIRSNFPTPEIMFYISGAEKGTYMASLQVASKIFSITGNSKDLQEMYSIALRAKAAVLKNQISENTVLYSSILTDSLRSTQLSLNYNISGYNKLIYEESNKKKPDTIKINLWKDELFEMNKEKVRMSGIISENYPQFDYLLKKTIPVSVFEVQKKLEKDEIILDYFLENQYSSGKRKLYTFIVSRSDLTYFEQEVDSTFRNNALVLKSVTSPLVDPGNIKHVLGALHYFYNYLIKPSQAEIKGKRLIVVPDEEINRLPFEAFLPDEPDSDRTDFDGLHFLLNDYIISHSYSASLLPGKINRTRGVEIYSFSPSYGAESDELAGAVREIRSVSAIMAGRLNTVDAVTKSGFLHALKDSAIFHLAMHSISDTLNSLYSYLLFDESGLNADSAKLYNFEISLNNINSPMIVLSSCNSGAGNLFSGEGQLSLARSFVLAGASSVIRTAWEVNDESGSEIIIRFYYYLAKGFSKDRALQLAKLDFLNKSTPEFQNPYYWAAYEILGDNGPVIRKAKAGRFVVISLLLILPVLFYLRRRRIFSAGLR
jgi:CHAT domain-containing protein